MICFFLFKFRNGDQYAGESHFVYKDEETNRSAVLSFLMESENVTDYQELPTDEQWKIYFDQAQKLIRENDSITIDLTLSALMGSDLKEFWRYNGSLTTPPCTENVIWTVFRRPIYIFNYEFESFRNDLFFESYRGPQPLYDRTVIRSFSDEIPTTIPDQQCCLKMSKGHIFFPSFFFAFFYSFIHFFARFV